MPDKNMTKIHPKIFKSVITFYFITSSNGEVSDSKERDSSTGLLGVPCTVLLSYSNFTKKPLNDGLI